MGFGHGTFATVDAGPATLLHGDPHIGNTYLLADGDIGFLDWQVLRRGNFSLDLGYFLQGAVTIDDRRVCERALIDIPLVAQRSRQASARLGAVALSRFGCARAHDVSVIAASKTWQRPEVSLTLAQRYAAVL